MRDPISSVSVLLGHVRGLFLPFGLFALVAVGVHVGCDRLDDHTFVALSGIDALLDEAAASLLRALAGPLGLGARTLEVWTVGFAELLDVERKELLARWIAVLLELATDLVLALPVFVYRAPPATLRAWGALLRRTFTDVTVLRVAGPIAALAATVAGAFAVAREVQVGVHSVVTTWRLESDLAALAASIAGFLALAFVAWRLGAVVVLGAITHADRRAARDVELLVAPAKRRLRGLVTLFVALPIALTALVATPVAGTLAALLWM